MAPAPLDVAVVTSWYPSVVDHVAGRFVADQVAALAADGRVRPIVVSFDPAGLVGTATLRARAARAVLEGSAQAVGRSWHVFSAAPAEAPKGIPTARLPIPEGRTKDEPILHAARHRAAALAILAGRWSMAGPAGDPSLPPQPTLVHAHTGYPDGAAAVTLANSLDVPLVITEHATFLDRLFGQPEIRASYIEAVLRAARLLAVSKTFANELRASLPEVADRVAVVPNTVAVDEFPLVALADRRPDELLFVGYWKEIKGIEQLLQALAHVRRARPTVTLRLVGEASDPLLDRRWRHLASELGVADAVAFDPPMGRRDVAAAMARASVFVHASRRETFGVVAAEALATGMPVVAADSGGVTEILGPDPEALGALVPAGDAAALAMAIERTLARRSAFDGAALRRSVVTRYGAAAVAAQLVELYGVIAEEWHASPDPDRPASVARPTIPERASEAAAGRVLVALDAERARLIHHLAPDVLGRLVLVTSRASRPGLPASLGGIEETDLHRRLQATADAAALGRRTTGWRRVVRVARHPLAAARRRGWIPGLERAVVTQGRAATARAIDRARVLTRVDEPPELVCVDGLDYLATADLVREGRARRAPGGIRWLADTTDSSTVPPVVNR